ncbi:prepilin-type N-terminal cleavage/methylation domain-containing protein [Calothrix sp. HK-06]|nr:prepilin-type N-terminal cleavage/methylation domain-containing protein [Calothrix sp. HK-06]
MRSLLELILSIRLKSFKSNTCTSGFTLIELLVAMVMAALIITPLMTFMIDILQTDRKEAAKSDTEQEMQTAYDYIARDLQQALYIYDADGITRDYNSTTPTLSGIRRQIPPEKPAPGCNDAATCQPILVFWKREFRPGSVNVVSTTDKNDGFAYSLVAYYLVTNPANATNSTWSPSARIGRFQIKGPINIAGANTTGDDAADVGFNRPPLDSSISGAKLKEKMNQWQAGTGTYAQPVVTLVDYVYNFPGTTTNSFQACAAPRAVGSHTSGFYACVDADEVVAQVFLRGNSYVRLYNKNNIAYNPSDNNSSYFPAVSGRIQGRGFLFTK